MSTKIWVDHLEDITRIARAYRGLLAALTQEPENGSDLFFVAPEITITCGDEPTGWSLIVEDGAVYLRVVEADDDR